MIDPGRPREVRGWVGQADMQDELVLGRRIRACSLTRPRRKLTQYPGKVQPGANRLVFQFSHTSYVTRSSPASRTVSEPVPRGNGARTVTDCAVSAGFRAVIPKSSSPASTARRSQSDNSRATQAILMSHHRRNISANAWVGCHGQQFLLSSAYSYCPKSCRRATGTWEWGFCVVTGMGIVLPVYALAGCSSESIRSAVISRPPTTRRRKGRTWFELAPSSNFIVARHRQPTLPLSGGR